MRILHTNYHKGWGGQSNRILIVCRGLRERGHEVVLAVPGGSKLHRRAEAVGIDVFPEVRFARGLRVQHLWHDVRALRGLMRRRSFDIVHTHGSQDSWAVAASLAGFRPRPVVLRTRHNLFPIRDHLPNRLLYGRWTDGLVCISSAVVAQCAAKPYLDAGDLTRIPSAVDAGRYEDGERDRVRRELGVENRLVIGMTGRLRPEKGHEHLLGAMVEVFSKRPDAVLVLAGSGSRKAELRGMAEDLNVAEHVVFTGFRKDIPDLLAAFDLFAMPSISEGLGTAVLEAAAAARPIVASDVGGIPDIVHHEETGLLVPPADPVALAKALLRLAEDRDLAARLGRAARERVRREFSEEALVEKTEGCYRDWLGRRGRSN